MHIIVVREKIKIPLIAACGVAIGRGMPATIIFAAIGVQAGSRFVASLKSSVQDNFKETIVNINERRTQLMLRKRVFVQLIKNKFYYDIQDLYQKNPTKEQLLTLVGRARAKSGMF